jgi:hypothetical protein
LVADRVGLLDVGRDIAVVRPSGNAWEPGVAAAIAAARGYAERGLDVS